MKVLLIGAGGREHAMAWKLSQSDKVSSLFIAPGNPGTAELGENVSLDVTDIDGLVAFARDEQIDLTVVGPELPLTLGVVDAFQAAGLKIFGPDKIAAQVEGSKAFAKDIMERAKVPTAAYETFSEAEKAKEYIQKQGAPIVVKVDGLAAGKGVFVCTETQDALSAVDEAFHTFSAKQIVVEEFLEGVEVSYIVATNGKSIVPFASSHDYKRIGEGDSGPNTGGMGTISPTPRLSSEQEQYVLNNVMAPVINELVKATGGYTGFLYGGLMLTPKGEVKVLEFNARLGDPETQSILRRMESDLFEVLYALSVGDVPPEVRWSPQTAVCVVMASKGYPASSSKGDIISGLKEAGASTAQQVFHAGTALSEAGEVVTGGGRVLAVTALGDDVDTARALCYQAVDLIDFEGKQFRRDIAA